MTTNIHSLKNILGTKKQGETDYNKHCFPGYASNNYRKNKNNYMNGDGKLKDDIKVKLEKRFGTINGSQKQIVNVVESKQQVKEFKPTKPTKN